MRWLDRLATICGGFAALFLCMIAVIIVAQIISRLMGMHIPAADDFAAWSMAASVFLGLPYAMLHGDHIRVTLILQAIPKKWHKAYELMATVIAIVISIWGTWHITQFVYESYVYKQLAQGMVKMPLWIPQLAMPIGLILFTLILIRRLIHCLQNIPLEETPHE